MSCSQSLRHFRLHVSSGEFRREEADTGGSRLSCHFCCWLCCFPPHEFSVLFSYKSSTQLIQNRYMKKCTTRLIINHSLRNPLCYFLIHHSWKCREMQIWKRCSFFWLSPGAGDVMVSQYWWGVFLSNCFLKVHQQAVSDNTSFSTTVTIPFCFCNLTVIFFVFTAILNTSLSLIHWVHVIKINSIGNGHQSPSVLFYVHVPSAVFNIVYLLGQWHF